MSSFIPTEITLQHSINVPQETIKNLLIGFSGGSIIFLLAAGLLRKF